MSQAVKAFGFYASYGKDSVESFAEVELSDNFAVLVWNERTILAEVLSSL